MDPELAVAQTVAARRTKPELHARAEGPSGSRRNRSRARHSADAIARDSASSRSANRSNVTMYTIDPRGLVGMATSDEQVDPQQWSEFVRKLQKPR